MKPDLRRQGSWSLDPVLMMFAALALAMVLTWLVPSGRFERTAGGLVKPGTFQAVAKPYSHLAFLPAAPESKEVYPASPAEIVTAIPVGMVRAAGLVFMITALGGMFGVLRATGTLEVAVERLVHLTGARTGLLTAVLMVALSAGQQFSRAHLGIPARHPAVPRAGETGGGGCDVRFRPRHGGGEDRLHRIGGQPGDPHGGATHRGCAGVQRPVVPAGPVGRDAGHRDHLRPAAGAGRRGAGGRRVEPAAGRPAPRDHPRAGRGGGAPGLWCGSAALARRGVCGVLPGDERDHRHARRCISWSMA